MRADEDVPLGETLKRKQANKYVVDWRYNKGRDASYNTKKKEKKMAKKTSDEGILKVWLIKNGEMNEDGREKCHIKTDGTDEWMEGLYWRERDYDAVYIPVMDETLTFNTMQIIHKFSYGVN